MAFAALSILISASDDRLPVPHAAVVLSCLGLANASPLHLQRELISRRPITPGTGEDPVTQLQVHIIRQIAPILQLRPLRRLLKLHNIPYKEYVNTKALRKRVKTFLNTGIIPGTSVPERDRAVLTGSARNARIVPDHLKKKLLANFKLEISAETLATFVCGSCTEHRPFDEKGTLSLEAFDINLLKRPDEFIDVHADETSEIESENEMDPHPWLDSHCPDPPMPLPANHPYQSLLIDPESLEQGPETMEPVIVLCTRCRSALKSGRVPALSVANKNYLGPVPAELQIVERGGETGAEIRVKRHRGHGCPVDL
ncbi:hypothetical protein C8F04DRAFT_1238619 [Mycena alexandri]|uniref:Uncharacterized protein n=1 Tax=Mycena alexandri TaxID=1745969 RepID=A0AAD6WVA0_9AGAR|nr:hypothetical protein C8F04DRAFT_1238619 [Mycena alexandri]